MTTLRALFTAFAPEYLERYLQPPHRPPPSHQRHPTVPKRRVRPPPFAVPRLWGPPPRPSFLWPSPLSSVSAAYNPAVAPAPSGPTSSPGRTSSSPAPSLRRSDPAPLASTPRVPRPVAGVCHGPQAAGPRRALHRHRLPGFTGSYHTWGRQLQYHPHIHSMVPGGGLAEDRTTWRPSRANCLCPRQSALPHLPCALQRREATGGPAGAARPRRSGPSPGMSTLRPITTATLPAPPSPPLSSRLPSPTTVS